MSNVTYVFYENGVKMLGSTNNEFDVGSDAIRDELLQRLQSTISHVSELEFQVKDLEASKNQAYKERNLMVQFLTFIYPSYLTKHPEDDLSWEQDWMNIVVVDGPGGQMSWHIHDSEMLLFSHLGYRENDWDGHTTEDKYKRLEHCCRVEIQRPLIENPPIVKSQGDRDKVELGLCLQMIDKDNIFKAIVQEIFKQKAAERGYVLPDQDSDISMINGELEEKLVLMGFQTKVEMAVHRIPYPFDKNKKTKVEHVDVSVTEGIDKFIGAIKGAKEEKKDE